MNFNIPDKVNYIIKTLMDNGYEAFAVGGCVRDIVLGKKPEDWDITTSADPEEIKRIFKRTVDTGIEHGTVTVLLDGDGFEVTTYRIDGKYEDMRHPMQVEFTSSLREDLRRRDFTINAMAYNNTAGLVDLFGGIEDLENKVIRCVGEPMERFGEDALRILRAIRFSAQLNFDIEKNTLKGIREKANLLKYVSAERISNELNKLLISDHPEKIRIAYDTGITKVIIPEFDRMMITRQNSKHHIYSVGEHTIKALCEVAGKQQEERFNVRERRILRWTILLHDIEKPGTLTTDQYGYDHFYGHEEKGSKTAKEILKRLKFDNDTLDTVVHLIKWHDYRFVLTPEGIRKATSKIGRDYMELIFEVNYADNMAKNPANLNDKMESLSRAKQLYEEMLTRNECVELKDLEISGKDLIQLNMEQGKEIGRVLNILLNQVIDKPELNKREVLLEMAMKIEKD